MKNDEESLPIYGRNPRRSLVYIAIQLVHSVIYACCVVRVAVVAILIVVVIIIDGIVAIVIGIIRLVGFFTAGVGAAVRRFGAVRSAALGGRFGRAMYPAVGRVLIRFSRAAALDTGILGSECADTQNAGSQRNEHCAKNAFPNSLFHGKVLSVMYGILPVTFSVRNHHRRNHPNQNRLN